MKLAIGSWTYGWQVGIPGYPPPAPLGWSGLLDKAIALGVSCVQFADNLPLHELDRRQMNALRAKARDHAIDLEVGMRGLTPKNLETYLPLTRALQSDILRVVIDQEGYQPDEDAVVSLLAESVSALRQHDIILAIENHDRFEARVFARMLERVGSDFIGICLDTANSFGAGEGVETVLDALIPFTVNLHVKDFAVSRLSHNLGFLIEGRPAGRGMLPIPSMLERLNDQGRCHSAVLELWTPPEAAIADTVTKEEHWARQSIAYLRGLIPP